MTPLLQQFLAESAESLQAIGEKLMQLEAQPDSDELMTELFRLVHTLKGNSGLFEYPELTRVLHAAEDLMDAVRNGKVGYSRQMADQLLDAMDFVSILCDEIELHERIDASCSTDSARLSEALRHLIALSAGAVEPLSAEPEVSVSQPVVAAVSLAAIPEPVRMAACRAGLQGATLYWLGYCPVEDCFFQGDDPFYQVRHTPGLLWGGITARGPWPALAELDAYCCRLEFQLLAGGPIEELQEYYRYVPDQVQMLQISPRCLMLPQGDPNGGPVYDDFVCDALDLLHDGNLAGLARAAESMLELSNPDLWLSSALRWLLLVLELQPDNNTSLELLISSLRTLTPPAWHTVSDEPVCPDQPEPAPETGALAVEEEADQPAAVVEPVRTAAEPTGVDAAIAEILGVQRQVLTLTDKAAWSAGRLKAVVASLKGCLLATGADAAALGILQDAADAAVTQMSAEPLLDWLDQQEAETQASQPVAQLEPSAEQTETMQQSENTLLQSPSQPEAEAEMKFGRRAEDAFVGQKSLRVDQIKIDRLMNLIGEMVVAKNALPYLAGRAESIYGVRELSREIKAQYAVINRIAEEMQDSIMQVRMMPVSFVFQRFPRLVRDISRKLGKEVHLLLEGEETEADKNVIEALGDPLMHIVRNSLDHGIELPEQRLAAGKPAVGTLVLRAAQEADRVVIEIRDDGKGIAPDVIKRKAYEKGLISEELLEKITDQEAVNLVFAPGFSTAETVSDLSGRGVGMDVVRSAIERFNGTVNLESVQGKGTSIRISLPLSMAVSNVMIIESNDQIFGVPMEAVVETVRVPRTSIKTIKKSMATVLRGKIVPLKSLNSLLGLSNSQKLNEDDEHAVLVVNLGGEQVGILIDEFHETVDIILKPMAGVLSGLSAYAGSALLGDGSVLMVLNLKEVL